jgi:aryl-alcohol dehydrogenase-like predicted oxidoreductase
MINKKYWYDLDYETNSIGFGCWQIAGSHSLNDKPHGWGQVSENDAISLLTKALSLGIDFYDTAQGYNDGRSEYLLGKAMKKAKVRPLVCTKIALSKNEICNNALNEQFIQKVEKSLTRLQVDRIDVLLIHNPPDSIDWSFFDHNILTKLKKDGKIGSFGISSSSISGAKNAIHASFGSTIEWVFNVFERRPEKELFPLLSEKKINYIARSPLSRGLINAKYINHNTDFGSNDFRSTLPIDWIDWVIKQLRKMNNNGVHSSDLISFAVNYYTKFSEVTSTIVGIKTIGQLSIIEDIMNSKNNKEYDNQITFKDIPDCFPKWK